MRKKSERGAVTLFVLIAGLSFIAILTTMLAVSAVRRQSQIAATNRAKEIYSSGDVNTLYEDFFAKGEAIPIYTVAELNEMCSGHDVTINEEGRKIYNFSSSAVYVLMNDLEFEYEGIWELPTFTNNGRIEGNNKVIKIRDTSRESATYYYYSGKNNFEAPLTAEGNIYRTLYAEVTFNANEGTGSMDPQTFTIGESQALSTNTFTNEGFRFVEWNTQANGTGTSYTNGQVASFESDTILYAQWIEMEKYWVTYVLGYEDFVGNNYMNADILLYSAQNFDRDFEIIIDAYDFDVFSAQADASQNAIISAQLEGVTPFPGFALRYKNSAVGLQGNATRTGESIIPWSTPSGTASIKRTDKILYFNDTLVIDFDDISSENKTIMDTNRCAIAFWSKRK